MSHDIREVLMVMHFLLVMYGALRIRNMASIRLSQSPRLHTSHLIIPPVNSKAI